MKPITITAIILLMAITMLNSQVIPLWPNEIPFAKATTSNEVIQKKDITRISNVISPTIEVYLAQKGNSTGQAVLICPGGGYGILAYDHEGINIAKWLNDKGISAFVLKYRLPKSELQTEPHKVPLADAQQAIRYIRERTAEYRLNKDQIGVMGFSAGGHLAASLSTLYDENLTSNDKMVSARPDFAILLYPVITMSEDYMHKGSMMNLVSGNQELMEHYSLDKQVNKNTPPTILIHAGDDRAVPVQNSLSYYKALLDNSVAAEMHVYPNGGHGFALAKDDAHLASWTDRCIAWIMRQNKFE